MWNVTAQPGLATAVVDFTHDYVVLAIGLFGLLALAGSFIVFSAMRQSLTHEAQPGAPTEAVPVDYREVA